LKGDGTTQWCSTTIEIAVCIQLFGMGPKEELDIKTITFSGLVTQNEIVFQRVLFKVNEIVNCAREIRN